MVFDDNDLIQANATIISGVLILLSLASLKNFFIAIARQDNDCISNNPFYSIDYIVTQSTTK